MKMFFTVFLITLIILLGFFTGVYIYRMNNLDKNNEPVGYVTSIVDDECTEISEEDMAQMLNSEETNAEEEIVSPNSTLTIKKLYTDCEHIIENSEKIDIELANLNKDEFQEKYKDWEIQKFTANDIVLYKEIEGFCDEHYLLKATNGYIGIYELDKNDTPKSLIKVTDIAVEYLTDTDLIEIEKGLKIYTKKELNKIIEDYE